MSALDNCYNIPDLRLEAKKILPKGLFEFIDRALPDAAMTGPWTGFRESIRWSVSSLVVSLPVFLYVSTVTNRDTRADPARRASLIAIRKDQAGGAVYRFDIHLQGADETVFFDV